MSGERGYTGRPERSPRESGDSPGSDGCTPWPAPRRPRCLASLCPRKPVSQPGPFGPNARPPPRLSRVKAGARARQLRGLPTCLRAAGVPRGDVCPAPPLDPVLRLSDADGPRLPGCTGPGAARAGQGPPAFPRPTGGAAGPYPAPTLAARASTAGAPRRGPGYLHEQPKENWVSARRKRPASSPGNRGEATVRPGQSCGRPPLRETQRTTGPQPLPPAGSRQF